MAIQKQNVDISFVKGLDTKTDKFRVLPGNFLRLKNRVFDISGELTKRNGFGLLSSLPSGTTATTITTFKNNLISIGNNISAYSASSNQWENRGFFHPCALNVQALVRTAYSQTTVDVAVSSAGAACTVFLDGDGSYKYEVSDVSTGQVLVSITNLPATATLPRVFVMSRYFVITFLATVAAAPHLQYIAIPLTNLSSPSAATDIATTVSGLTAGYDGVVANGNLYVAWDGNDGGGAIRVNYLDSTLTLHTTRVLSGHASSLMSLCVDETGSTLTLWVTAYKTTNAYTAALNQNLTVIRSLTQTINTITVPQITSTAQNGVCTIFYGTSNVYSGGAVRSDYLSSVTINTAGTVGTPAVVARSVELASKAFLVEGTSYFLSTYSGAFQPTYFLLNSSGNVIAKLAYANGGGLLATGILPSVSLVGSKYYIGYLFKDLIAPVSKNQAPTSVSGVYTQTGVNVAAFDFTQTELPTVEIGQNRLIPGGIVWMFDGVKPVEQNFNLWPEDIVATPSTSGGSMADQQYYYQVTYEWTDGQGNIHRSAPSVAVSALVSGGGGSGSVSLQIPTLRLTYKTSPNAIRIVIYRWSTAQQNYYQTTSVSSPTLNNPAADTVTYVDTHTDASIIGNSLIYTTGGVVENIAPPSTKIMTLYKSRLILVNAEDPNQWWFSKQTIENTPVELSDLFTKYLAPTSGAQGSTGDIASAEPLDDKLVFNKKDAIYYLTGNGPDITGSNDDFSEPVFVTATVGCENQNSIAFIPNGIVFKSDKGIWILKRDLGTDYLGASVQDFNDAEVLSAQVIPGTNQVRFLLDSGTWLMYDYFEGQWGTFDGIAGISSTLYNSLHTYLDESGNVFQETPGVYVDNSNPVLQGFTTGWFSLAGIQGYQRAFYFNLLGTYYSPHLLNMYIAYDYNPSPTQVIQLRPTNYAPTWGGESTWGSGPAWGGPGNIEQWKVNLQNQRCQAFQITIEEQYDSAFFQSAPGQGLTLSGMNLVVGVKKGFVPLGASQTVG